MDYTHLLEALNQASLFDLYRLSMAIRRELDNPRRIASIKKPLRIGMEITYFDYVKNRPVASTLRELRPQKAVLFDNEEQQTVVVPYYMLNINGVDTGIDNRNEVLTANNLSVGEIVGFNDHGQDRVGVIQRLNQKTVTLITRDDGRWRVAYGHLYRVHDTSTVTEPLLPNASCGPFTNR